MFFARRGVHIGGRDGFREDIAIDCGRVHFDVFCEEVQQGSHFVPGIPHRKLGCRILEVAREALRSESAGCSEIGSCVPHFEKYKQSAGSEVRIMSYDMFRRHGKLLYDGVGVVVCDEGHRLKSPTAVITKCVQSLGTHRRLILSGTPVQNNLPDFFHC